MCTDNTVITVIILLVLQLITANAAANTASFSMLALPLL
jgi:hypothetical protein